MPTPMKIFWPALARVMAAGNSANFSVAPGVE
jgi:hypothetical protein